MRTFRDEDATVSRLLHYWPLVLVLFSGVAAYLNLSYKVDSLWTQSDARQKTLDEQRERRSAEMELIRTRLTRIEDWRSSVEK